MLRAPRVALVVAGILAVGSLAGTQAAMADDSPVPEQVTGYFATGLVPRLIDLYGSSAGTEKTTKVGAISRIYIWSDDFLASKKTSSPTTFTNDWIAPVTVNDKPFGLATVWINPSSELPELAGVDLGPAVVAALAKAPKDSSLVRDDGHSAWFALKGTVLTPLVPGTSGVTAPTTPAAFQAAAKGKAASAAPKPVVNQGLFIAGITLGVVVLLLAGFVLLPDRRRGKSHAEDVVPAGVPDALPPADGVTLQGASTSPEKVAAAPKPVAKKTRARQQMDTFPEEARQGRLEGSGATVPAPKPAVRKPAATKSAATKSVATKPAAKKRERVVDVPLETQSDASGSLRDGRGRPPQGAGSTFPEERAPASVSKGTSGPTLPRKPAPKRAVAKKSVPKKPAAKKPAVKKPVAEGFEPAE